MTARSIRRASEHKARKEGARRARTEEGRLAQASFAQLVAAPSDPHDSVGAALSNVSLPGHPGPKKSGPNTQEGKAKSPHNAVKTGLTGRTVLLPSDDAALYERCIQQFADEFQPVGPFESNLVQALADTAWRLLRIPALEMAVYAYAHEQFSDNFADRELELQHGLIQMHTFLHYEKQLRNLQIQEARLRRNREKDTVELRRLQQERRENEQSDLALPPKAVATSGVPQSSPDLATPVLAAAEFEFSIDDVDAQLNSVSDYLNARRAAQGQPELPSSLTMAA